MTNTSKENMFAALSLDIAKNIWSNYIAIATSDMYLPNL